MSDLIEIDGAAGEGGGQVLRSSLTLSMITGMPFRIRQIRAGRRKPGLLRQHLTATRAAMEISGASAEGVELGSGELTFHPSAVKAGQYQFAIGTAGSSTLVLQTVLPALVLADGPSTVTLEGGTHNSMAPPYDFLTRAFLPLLGRMGANVETTLERPGFYPAGGGRFHVKISHAAKLEPLELLSRGEIVNRRARALVAHLPRVVGDREMRTLRDKLGLERHELHVEETAGSLGPGNVVFVELESEHVTEIFTGFGEKMVRAERVATEVADATRRYLAANVPVGPHLADQLLIPLALAGSGVFRTVTPSSHTTTNIDVIRRFLGIDLQVREHEGAWIIEAK